MRGALRLVAPLVVIAIAVAAVAVLMDWAAERCDDLEEPGS